MLLGPESRAECFLTNSADPGANFTPHVLISYHMEEQNYTTLQGITMLQQFIVLTFK